MKKPLRPLSKLASNILSGILVLCTLATLGILMYGTRPTKLDACGVALHSFALFGIWLLWGLLFTGLLWIGGRDWYSKNKSDTEKGGKA